jgi:hypothetical protein
MLVIAWCCGTLGSDDNYIWSLELMSEVAEISDTMVAAPLNVNGLSTRNRPCLRRGSTCRDFIVRPVRSATHSILFIHVCMYVRPLRLLHSESIACQPTAALPTTATLLLMDSLNVVSHYEALHFLAITDFHQAALSDQWRRNV